MSQPVRITIITLFPEFFDGPLSCGLMQRAREAGILEVSFRNPRDAATDRHRTVDDRPYGGGPGMVLMPGPVAATLRSLGFGPRGEAQPGRLFMLAPKGRVFDQAMARELAACALAGASSSCHAAARAVFDRGGEKAEQGEDPAGHAAAVPAQGERREKPCLTLLCGRYEGLDARIEELFPVEPVSVGDFVLNGGEAAALCLLEAVCRLLPGYMGHEESGEDESFSAGLLEYPHYTRPEDFEGLRVPDALRSGDHARIALWRRQASLAQTLETRPALLGHAPLDEADRAFLRHMAVERPGRNLYCALVHYPVLDREGRTVAVSLTNLDVHDIARSARTYGLGGYYVVTPLEDQRELLDAIVSHWTDGPGRRGNPDRDRALSLVRGCAAVEDAVNDIAARTGERPLVVGTTARDPEREVPLIGFSALARTLRERPVLLLFGTGHGLSPEQACDAVAPSLRWHGGYNHLSVRSAASIMFDRILGDWL